jgi:hypothetical protein
LQADFWLAWQVQNCPKALDRFRLWLYLDLPTLKILRTKGCISTLLGATHYLQLSWFSLLPRFVFGVFHPVLAWF